MLPRCPQKYIPLAYRREAKCGCGPYGSYNFALLACRLMSNFGVSGWIVLIFFGAILVPQAIQQVSKVVPKWPTPLEYPAPAKHGCGLHEKHNLEL